MDINHEEIQNASKLADGILAVVMESENVPPEAVISALAHVASLVASELKMPEQVFAYCMTQSYRAILTTKQDQEVH